MTQLPGAFQKDPVVVKLLLRLKRNHIDLQPFLAEITRKPWASNPMGFCFRCSDPSGLAKLLGTSPSYGRATAPFDLMLDGVVFREVSQPDSLHLRLKNDSRAESVIHLDSVSIVEARDNVGQIVYAEDQAVLIKHLAVDKLHLAWK